jgi:hypothetical protein
MDQNLFFRWIWRFNALGIAALLLAVGFAMRGLLPLALDVTTPPDRTSTIETAGQERPKFSLRMYDAIYGTGIIIFSYGDLYESKGGSFSPPRAASTVNYLFYDARSGTSRWLFTSNKQHITSLNFVWDDGSADERSPQPFGGSPILKETRTVGALVIDAWTALGRDGAPSYHVYASRPDGSGLTMLIDGADETTVFTPVDQNTIVIANTRGGRTYATTFSLTNFKKVSETDLTKEVPK